MIKTLFQSGKAFCSLTLTVVLCNSSVEVTWPSELLACYRLEYNKEGKKMARRENIYCLSLLFLHDISVFFKVKQFKLT